MKASLEFTGLSPVSVSTSMWDALLGYYFPYSQRYLVIRGNHLDDNGTPTGFILRVHRFTGTKGCPQDPPRKWICYVHIKAPMDDPEEVFGLLLQEQTCAITEMDEIDSRKFVNGHVGGIQAVGTKARIYTYQRNEDGKWEHTRRYVVSGRDRQHEVDIFEDVDAIHDMLVEFKKKAEEQF